MAFCFFCTSVRFSVSFFPVARIFGQLGFSFLTEIIGKLVDVFLSFLELVQPHEHFQVNSADRASGRGGIGGRAAPLVLTAGDRRQAESQEQQGRG